MYELEVLEALKRIAEALERINGQLAYINDKLERWDDEYGALRVKAVGKK